jgi:hypothetical protein
MNKAILTCLLDLPINEADGDRDRIVKVGMDWTGPLGYVFAVTPFEVIYVARKVSTLLMPVYLDEIPSFEQSLDFCMCRATTI